MTPCWCAWSSAERLAAHIGHHVVQQAVGRARIEQWQDVRMLPARRGADLAEKPLGA
jgi:hypothetical protein